MDSIERRRYNEFVLSILEEGDLVAFPRGIWCHWAVYIGNKEVVHLTGDPNASCSAKSNSSHVFSICGSKFDKAIVKQDNFFQVAGDSIAIRICNDGNAIDKQLTVLRALSSIDEVGYNILWKNCECFANWCKSGVGWSRQSFEYIGTIASFSCFGAVVGGPAGAVVGAVIGALSPILIWARYELMRLEQKHPIIFSFIRPIFR